MVLFLSCTSEKEISSQYIVDKAIEVAGGEQFLNSEIAFTLETISILLREVLSDMN